MPPPSAIPPLATSLLADLPRGDFVGFTFLLGTFAMFGSSIFFYFERSQVVDRWKTSLLVAALITTIACINYVGMSAIWLFLRASPAEFRYLDWLLTVPLLCLQFYLLLDAANARPSRLMILRLVAASVWMLGWGYVGQAIHPERTMLWGAVSTLGYAVILFEITFGEARRLSGEGDEPLAKQTFDLLFLFIFIGWAIYPIGYMTMPGNLLARWHAWLNVDIIYNLGDAINKVGFGLVVWRQAKAAGQRRQNDE